MMSQLPINKKQYIDEQKKPKQFSKSEFSFVHCFLESKMALSRLTAILQHSASHCHAHCTETHFLGIHSNISMLTNFVPQLTKACLIQLAFAREPAKLFQEYLFNKQTKRLQLYWGKEDLF